MSNEKWAWATFGVIAGIFLLSSPKCNRGCKTLAEHLISHGLDVLL